MRESGTHSRQRLDQLLQKLDLKQLRQPTLLTVQLVARLRLQHQHDQQAAQRLHQKEQQDTQYLRLLQQKVQEHTGVEQRHQLVTLVRLNYKRLEGRH